MSTPAPKFREKGKVLDDAALIPARCALVRALPLDAAVTAKRA